jgi:hypothetical protein
MVLEEAAAGFLYSLKKQRSAACEAQPAKQGWSSVGYPLLRGPQRGPLWSPQPCPSEGICARDVASCRHTATAIFRRTGPYRRLREEREGFENEDRRSPSCSYTLGRLPRTALSFALRATPATRTWHEQYYASPTGNPILQEQGLSYAPKPY